jgi:hypothetical protein
MLNIVKYKGCKRCGGDLFLERDTEESYVFCLQCGAVSTKQDVPRIPIKPRLQKVYTRQGSL